MYSYEDTEAVVTPQTPSLPAEAVSINGTYLENIIDGYRTLYVKGRESLGINLNTYSVGTADGERVKGRRYPARTLTVGFQLLCPTDEEFRLRFNQLNNILSLDEADFIFNDETDKFFTGYAVMDANVEAGRNNVTGEWKIYCAYPFKRSTEVTVLSSDDLSGVVVGDHSATFTFNYNGVIPAKPVLRCEFAGASSGGDFTEDGDCGYVAFLNQDESIVQLGNPEVIDVDVTNKNDTLINRTFTTLDDWTASGMTVGNIADTYWNKGQGQTQAYATGVGTLSKSTTGAVDFDFDMVHRLCVNSSQQTGSLQCRLLDNGTTVVGFTIDKTGSGTSATVSYIINGQTVGTDIIDLSYYNTNFGYCNRTPVYVTETYQERVLTYTRHGKPIIHTWERQGRPMISYETRTRQVQTGWNYTQSNLNTSIRRSGRAVTFKIGNLASRTFKRASIAVTPVYDLSLQTTGTLNTNAIRSVKLVSKAGVPFADIPNVFTSGDIVEADCNNANVYLYRDNSLIGSIEEQYGALGNDWETFELKVGTNIIRAVWSDWVNVNYKPKIQILFNKVYI